VERPGFLDKGIYGTNPYPKYPKGINFGMYSSRISGDYGDARGVEISLKTLFSNNFVANINYSFSKTTYGKGTPTQIHFDKDGTVTYNWYVKADDRLPVEKSYSRPHILRANFFVQYPDHWKVPVLDQLFENSDLSLLYRYISGQAFTYLEPDDPPDLLDNHRFPAWHSWDLKFNKYFKIGNHTFTGEPTLTLEEGKDPITGDPILYNISYMIYHNPRSIWFGIRYNFR